MSAQEALERAWRLVGAMADQARKVGNSERERALMDAMRRIRAIPIDQ